MDVMKCLLEFTVCVALIVVAGTVLTKCADAIAGLTKLGWFLVGSVLLAGATSLPELTVDISAIRLGAPDLAIGDLLGSSLANLLILAVLVLAHHSNGHMLFRRSAEHALSGGMSSALTALAGIALLTGQIIGEVTLLGISPGLLLVAAAYIGGVRIVYHDQRVSAVEAVVAVHEAHEPPNSRSKAVLGFVVAAIRMKAYDLAIGNVFSSDSFNMLLLVPLDAMHPGCLDGFRRRRVRHHLPRHTDRDHGTALRRRRTLPIHRPGCLVGHRDCRGRLGLGVLRTVILAESS